MNNPLLEHVQLPRFFDGLKPEHVVPAIETTLDSVRQRIDALSEAIYRYKWAEVLSSDAHALGEEIGAFDRSTGLAFLRHILEQGGSRDPMALFVACRGREPRMDALLRHSGLAG